jgi:hypothetical protein
MPVSNSSALRATLKSGYALNSSHPDRNSYKSVTRPYQTGDISSAREQSYTRVQSSGPVSSRMKFATKTTDNYIVEALDAIINETGKSTFNSIWAYLQTNGNPLNMSETDIKYYLMTEMGKYEPTGGYITLDLYNTRPTGCQAVTVPLAQVPTNYKELYDGVDEDGREIIIDYEEPGDFDPTLVNPKLTGV